MRLPTVWLPGARTGELAELSAEEAHHLVRVLHRRVGDEVLAAAADGRIYHARIEELEPGRDAVPAVVRVEEPVEDRAPLLVPWTVAVAPVRSSDMDLAVRLASELGLERLVPLVSERGQVAAERSGRPLRWQRIARESAKQCGRATPLEVSPPADLERVLGAAGPETGLWIATPGASFAPPGELRDPRGLTPALFLVGPEGGFTPAEVERAAQSGARPIGFPTPILRSPTAVVFVAALGALLRI